MVRVIRDLEVRDTIDIRQVVSRIEEGYRADARGDVVPFPRSRIEARGTTLAWLGASMPSEGLLGFRSYLYGPDGSDVGHQIVALYGQTDMELRAIFLGRLVGNLRTGAAIAAALHLIDPGCRDFGLIGTGNQARNALTCLAATFPGLRVVTWSPSAPRRTTFQRWAGSNLGLDVELADSAAGVLRKVRTVALVTSSETPVVTSEMLRESSLLLSINAYRRLEIDRPLLEAASQVWTDSVAQASGPGTLFEENAMKSKLRPLVSGLEDGALRDGHRTRIVINTGAAWEEVATAEALFELAVSREIGTELDMRADSVDHGVI